LNGGATPDALDWFAQRLLRARALMPGVKFDTVLGEDFAQLATSDLVDQTDTIDLFAETTLVRAGVVGVAAGDSGTDGIGTLVLKDSGAHVQAQNFGPWYAAGLAKVIRPTDVSGTTCDLIGLGDADDATANFVALGLRGPQNPTNWVLATYNGIGVTTIPGPALDGDESPKWHLAEFWLPPGSDQIHAALDGTNFAATLDVANVGASYGRLRSRIATGAGNPVTGLWDKWAVVCLSMTVGEP
jgi:hypothetical protein